MTHPSEVPPAVPAAQPRKAALAAWIGSALEYYDFFIYGTAAALVFDDVFFPSSNPATAHDCSRWPPSVWVSGPAVGAVVLGHIGDKLGRKTRADRTMLLMGVVDVR